MRFNPYNIIISKEFINSLQETLDEAQKSTDIGEQLLKYKKVATATREKFQSAHGNSFIMMVGSGAVGGAASAFFLGAAIFVAIFPLPILGALALGCGVVKYWQHKSPTIDALAKIDKQANGKLTELTSADKLDVIAVSPALQNVMRTFPEVKGALEEKFMLAAIREKAMEAKSAPDIKMQLKP